MPFFERLNNMFPSFEMPSLPSRLSLVDPGESYSQMRSSSYDDENTRLSGYI